MSQPNAPNARALEDRFNAAQRPISVMDATITDHFLDIPKQQKNPATDAAGFSLRCDRSTLTRPAA